MLPSSSCSLDLTSHPGGRHPTARATPHVALLAVGAVVALALGSCAVVDDDNATTDDTATRTDARAANGDSDEPRYARYVALGDSFAAFGPVAAPMSGPESCLRSSRNYPAVLAESPQIADMVDVTCGGARTTDMTTRQIAQTPPQFDALTGDTDLVTLSIGGNDIGFGDIAVCVVTTRA